MPHTSSKSFSILPIRFTVQDASLEHLGAHILTVDWVKDARRLLETLATHNRTRNGKVYLPTLSLDTAMSAINPVVAHGYREIDESYDRYYTLSLHEQPNPALIANLTTTWADIWAERHFPTRLAHPDFRDLRDRMASISQWQDVSAHAVLYDSSRSRMRYSVIPSLLSVLFVSGGPSNLGGKTVYWGLAQQADRNGWQVVSSPVSARNGATYAYLVRFSVQYQPGIEAPRIHAAIICQRYADNPITDTGNRRVSMLCRLGRPMMAQGNRNDNLIRLVVDKYSTDGNSFGPGFPESYDDHRLACLLTQQQFLLIQKRFRGEEPEQNVT